MVRIRLRRVGAKRQPSYRIVVADHRSPRDGRFIESIGYFNPRTEPETIQYDEGRALHWLSVGAQPSEAVRRLLNNGGTYGRLERLRQGESIEKLIEEAETEWAARPPVSPKTRHEPREGTKSKKKAKAEAAEPQEAVAEAEAEAEAEVEAAEVEAEVEEVAEAQAEEAEASVDTDAEAEAEADSESEESDAEESE